MDFIWIDVLGILILKRVTLSILDKVIDDIRIEMELIFLNMKKNPLTSIINIQNKPNKNKFLYVIK